MKTGTAQKIMKFTNNNRPTVQRKFVIMRRSHRDDGEYTSFTSFVSVSVMSLDIFAKKRDR